MGGSEKVKAGRPGAASGVADEESGSEGLSTNADAERDLFALRVMHERGLIDEETYHQRYRAIAGKLPDAGDL